MIDMRLVQWYAADSSVDLDIAEREVVLTYVLRLMLDAGLLQHLSPLIVSNPLLHGSDQSSLLQPLNKGVAAAVLRG
jgi:hypothetical protein